MNEWLTPVVDAYTEHFGMSSAPVVWEVGSRDGIDGYELMRRISNHDWRAEQSSTVVCIEPNPDQVAIIRKSYPQAIVHEVAVADKKRKAKFKVYHGNEGDVGSSSLHMDWKKGSGLKSHIIQVQVVRLDSLIGDEIIDVAKVDVEGMGYEALVGLGKKLNQIRVIHIETEKDSKSDIKVRKYLEERGWIITDETEQWGSMPDLTAVNANLV